MAEHMLILKLTSPRGRGQVHRGRVPERLRQDQPGDDDPDAPGLEGRDDRRRHRLDEVRRRRPAVRGQPGGRASSASRPGTGARTNPNAIDMVGRNTIFTNCARTDDGDIWWEGLTGEPPAHAIDWQRQRLDAGVARRRPRTPTRASPCAAAQCPSIAPEWEDPAGVPIYGDPVRRPPRDGRAARARGPRLGARRVPRLDHVVGDDRRAGRRRSASCASTRWRCCRSAATTWATTSATGCGSAQREGAKLPAVFYVNWFRKDADGKFLWPGFGENSRVLAWIFRRCRRAAPTRSRPRSGWCRRSARAGSTPTASTSSEETMRRLLEVDTDGLAAAAAADPGALREVRRQAPGRAARAAHALELRLRAC